MDTATAHDPEGKQASYGAGSKHLENVGPEPLDKKFTLKKLKECLKKKPNGKINEYQLRLSDDNNVRVFDIKKLSKDEIDIYRDLDDGDSEEYLLEPVAE